MATTFADLEARVRGLESRSQRAEEDITAIVTTVVSTREDVAWLKRAVQALLDHQQPPECHLRARRACDNAR